MLGSLLGPRPCVANSLAKFTEHQVVVVVGETGAGKTTQYVDLSLVSTQPELMSYQNTAISRLL